MGQEHPTGKLQGLPGPPSQGPCFLRALLTTLAPCHPHTHALALALADPTPNRTGISSASKGQIAWVRSSSLLGTPLPSEGHPQAYLTLARTFSKEAGLTKEKQMRKTSWGGRAQVEVFEEASVSPPTPGLQGPPGWPRTTYGLRVGERPKPVIIFLPSSVPQPQVDRLPVHHHVG